MIQIIAPTRHLVKYLLLLNLRLSKPQLRDTKNIMEAMIMCESTKTISAMNRLLWDRTDPSAVSDFFTYSPWNDDEVRQRLQSYLTSWALEEAEGQFIKPPILIIFDDSLAKKPKESHHFEPVDWHFDVNDKRHYGHVNLFKDIFWIIPKISNVDCILINLAPYFSSIYISLELHFQCYQN